MKQGLEEMFWNISKKVEVSIRKSEHTVLTLWGGKGQEWKTFKTPALFQKYVRSLLIEWKEAAAYSLHVVLTNL